jgi:hypothetical protein
LTTLRLGLLPGDDSRSEIDRLLTQQPHEIAQTLREAYANDTLAQLLDRLDGIYSKVPEINHVSFWKGVGLFLQKPDCEWMASYNPMHEVVQSFAEILERCVLRNESFRSRATAIFRVPDRGSGNPTPLGGMGSRQ